MLNTRRFIIFGHAGHGKDTACQYLAKRFNVNACSSSYFAAQRFLFDQIQAYQPYETLEACYEDRASHRQYWYEAIKAYNTPDLTRLGRELLGCYRIYNGIRDLEEFQALKEAELFELAIWIDASERLPAEPTTSMKLGPEHSDLIISNNNTPLDLYKRLERVFSLLL